MRIEKGMEMRLRSKKKVYHVTTPRKLKRYELTGGILPPVRYWTTLYSAVRWARRTGRTLILVFDEPEDSYPLPIKGGAKWCKEMVRKWEVIEVSQAHKLLKGNQFIKVR